MTLKGAVAVVTGASSGVGRALTLALAGEGAAVCLVGRSAQRLEDVAREARVEATRVETYPADLGDVDSVRRLAGRLGEDFDRLDVLVHSAGVIAHGSVESASVEDLDRQYATNVRGPYLLTQATLGLLRRSAGQVVFINSSVGLRGKRNVSAYSASKHALRALADSLRDEVNGDRIRVLSVFLGRTATAMQAAIHRATNQPYRPEQLIQPADVAAVVLNALTLPRTAEVTDISLRPLVPGDVRE
jgi:NAD(P)-dependent dehydrogenase (short-subunit alcohol dehydrogenase family)